MAGYENYKEGGVGPVFLKVIPLAERRQFKMYAATLLEGPDIEPTVRLALTMALLLRYEDVKADYPDHRLLIEMKTALQKCNIAEALFLSWITRVKEYNKIANKGCLTLSQVI